MFTLLKDERKKLNLKARKYILLGYGNETKSYRLYDPIQSRVIHSRDVLFNEFTRGVEKERIEKKKQLELSLSNSSEDELMINEDEGVASQFEDEETHNEPVNTKPVKRRSTRERKQPDKYGVWVNAAIIQNKEPSTVNEALNSSEKNEWRQAMEEEVKSMHKNDVWELVEPPQDRQVIGSKWVFKRKIDSGGSVEC